MVEGLRAFGPVEEVPGVGELAWWTSPLLAGLSGPYAFFGGVVDDRRLDAGVDQASLAQLAQLMASQQLRLAGDDALRMVLPHLAALKGAADLPAAIDFVTTAVAHLPEEPAMAAVGMHSLPSGPSMESLGAMEEAEAVAGLGRRPIRVGGGIFVETSVGVVMITAVGSTVPLQPLLACAVRYLETRGP